MAGIAVVPESGKTQKTSRLAEMVQFAEGTNAARVLVSLLVVMFHAAVPYMTSPTPIWIVHDTAQHVSIDMLVFAVNGFAMPFFFLLAGLSIAKSSLQKPFWEFSRHRTSRLGQTFLLALILIGPVILLSWGIGLLWTERLTISNLSRLSFPKELRNHFGPGHLWFLEYLLLLSVAWAAIARLGLVWSFSNWLIQGKWAHWIFRSAGSSLLLAMPTAAILLIDVETPFRLVSAFVPDPSRLLYYFVFLIGGVWLANQPHAHAFLRSNALANLLIAAVVFVGLFPLTMSVFEKTLTGSDRWVLACLQSVFAWSMIFGLLGGMIRWCSRSNETIRYNNEASFWIYLAHMPVVCIMQLVVLKWDVSPWLKLIIVSATGLGVTLILYELCVRYSFLGAVINGRRIPHATKRGWRLEACWLGLFALGITSVSGFIWSGWNSICVHHVHTVSNGQVYRCNRPKPIELETILKEKKVSTVINLAAGSEQDEWFRTQRKICNQQGVSLVTLSFHESRPPTAAELRQLQIALISSSRPVLLIGGKRSPTLSGFGSAVAVLMEGGTIESALEQFDMRFFQLEGAERCIVAEPLREYRRWLATEQITHSANNFCLWTEQVKQNAESRKSVSTNQPDRQATMGAPRYPRQF